VMASGRALCVGAVLLIVCLVPASAGAAVVTVGPILGSSTADHHPECESALASCFFAQRSPAAAATIPVTGKIVTWRVKGATGMVALRLRNGNTGGLGTVFESAEGGKSVFPADLAVEAGQSIGVVLAPGAKIGAENQTGASFGNWSPPLEYGEARGPNEEAANVQLLLNVDVQPAPVITGVTPSSGPTDTDDTVTITGTDFKEVTGVTFGFLPAEFQAVSETEIVAHTSYAFDGPVDVSVTARGGTGTAPAAFTYVAPPPPTFPGVTPVTTPDLPSIPPVDIPPTTFPKETPECHVPKLKGKTLKQAKPLLTAAHCKLGKVTKRKGVKAARGKVVASVPPAGAPARNGWPVKVTLG
jgi:hypothetical protein